MVENQAAIVNVLQRWKYKRARANSAVWPASSLHWPRQSMANKHQMRKGTKSTWDGRQKGRNLFDAGEIDIAHNFPVDRIDASVKHHGSWLDHIGGDAGGSSNADHQNIGASCDTGKVLCVRVANSYGGVLAHQDERGWLAADVAAPDHHGVASG